MHFAIQIGDPRTYFESSDWRRPVHVPTIVCPVDYSDASRRALRYAGAIASHFGARLSVLHVADPLLVGGAALQQVDLLGYDGREELRTFVEDVLRSDTGEERPRELSLVMGNPAGEILTAVEKRHADLVVMGTVGRSGMRKALFGSVAQAVLRRSAVPILAIPLAGNNPAETGQPLIRSGPVLAPVDFTAESIASARVAAGLARALKLPLLLLHVIPPRPVAAPGWEHTPATGDRMRTRSATLLMRDLAESLDPQVLVLSRIDDGDPAEVVAKLAREETASAIVMGLGSRVGDGGGQQPGSVAYRVLCLAPVPVLALPAAAFGRVYVQHIERAHDFAGVH